MEWVLRSSSLEMTEDMLGHGRHGNVYRGYYDQEEVAIKKVSRVDMALDEETSLRLAREIEALTTLEHPNIVSILGYVNTEDAMLIVFELIAGGDLKKWLSEPKLEMNWKQRVLILIQIARAIQYLHSNCKYFLIFVKIIAIFKYKYN